MGKWTSVRWLYHPTFFHNEESDSLDPQWFDEYMNFHLEKMATKAINEFHSQIEQHLRKNAESGMAAFMSDDESGMSSITSSIPAIKAPNNPHYDEGYTRKNALNLIAIHIIHRPLGSLHSAGQQC